MSLAGIPGVEALVVGDVMLDEYVWGEVERISPEAPVPVVEVHDTSRAPGGAANAAAGLVALGVQRPAGRRRRRRRTAEGLRAALAEKRVGRRDVVVDADRSTTTQDARDRACPAGGPHRLESVDALAGRGGVGR